MRERWVIASRPLGVAWRFMLTGAPSMGGVYWTQNAALAASFPTRAAAMMVHDSLWPADLHASYPVTWHRIIKVAV